MFGEMGLKLSTSTVNDWIHATANILYPLYQCQRKAVMQGGYVQIDEVPWNIADRKGQSCRKGYAWQFRDVSAHPRGTYFFYHKGSRGGEIPRTQLREYQGVIQNDGYTVYNQFENVPGITLLGCMAHVRRKFVDAQSTHPLAAEAVKYIATLYSLEENLKNQGATADQILQERQRLAVPILDGLEAWMHAALMTCTPQDPLAKAIKYALPLWPRIKRYTEDGNYHIQPRRTRTALHGTGPQKLPLQPERPRRTRQCYLLHLHYQLPEPRHQPLPLAQTHPRAHRPRYGRLPTRLIPPIQLPA